MNEQLATELATLVRLLSLLVFGGLLIGGYICMLKWCIPESKPPQPTPDVIDWTEVIDLLESVDCKLAAVLDGQDTVLDLGRCCKCGDESGICPQEQNNDPSQCPRLQARAPVKGSGVDFGACVGGPPECKTAGCPHKSPMMTQTETYRWEWKPTETYPRWEDMTEPPKQGQPYQEGDWTDAEYRKSMEDRGFTLAASASVDPAELPLSQTLEDATVQGSFGGTVVPSYKKGGPYTPDDEEWKRYLNQSLLTMRQGREQERTEGLEQTTGSPPTKGSVGGSE